MSPSRPIPEALLERYLAGDLSADERRALEQRLEASPEERDRLAALRADTAAFMVKHPPGPTVAKLEARSPARAPSWWGYLVAPLLATAAALIFFVWVRPVIDSDDVGIKGELALKVYRQTGAGAEQLASGSMVEAGDKVRFEVRAAKDGWVAVLSKDAAGNVTVYYPYQGTAAAKYRTAEPLLPGAIGLDQTRGTEEIWALYAREPFELGAHVEALRKGGAPVFAGVSSAQLSWTKK